MIDALDGLWHQPVNSINDQDDDVCHLRTARTHCREGFVTRRVDKCDHSWLIASLDFNLKCPSGLGDSTRFACCNIRAADSIQKSRLAVIDMPKNRDNCWTRTLVGSRARCESFFDFIRCGLRFVDFNFNIECHHQFHRLISIKRCIDCDWISGKQRFLHELRHLHTSQLRKFLHRNWIGNMDWTLWLGHNRSTLRRMRRPCGSSVLAKETIRLANSTCALFNIFV